MIQKILSVCTTTLVVAAIGVFAAFALSAPALAAGSPSDGVSQGINAIGSTGGGTDLPTVLKKIVNVLLFIIGAVSVIMIVIGGLKYVTSNGDSSQVTSAKNTILYAVIGVVVAALAYAIVNFFADQFTK